MLEILGTEAWGMQQVRGTRELSALLLYSWPQTDAGTARKTPNFPKNGLSAQGRGWWGLGLDFN